MNDKFRIPFTIILVFVAITAFSGIYPISLLVLIIAMGGMIYLIGAKTGYDWGRMLIYGIISFFFVLLIYISLFELGDYIPVLRRILLWPIG